MPTTESAEPKRQRGAQPGNTNALRHGAYARAKLTAHTLELLADAKGRSPADLCDLLWVEILRCLESGDYDPRNVAALATALTRAELAAMRLAGTDADTKLTNAIQNALADVARAQEHIANA